MQAEQRLVQKIASRPSTEELIFFIAEDDAINSACSELQKKIASNNKKELGKIHALCQRYHISLVHLTRELNHIQNIFVPQETISDDHKILGLQAGANIAEVKQVYRKLSIKYHPDTSDKNDTTKFIEITKAYQRIINSADKKERHAPPSPPAWRYRKKTPPPPQQRKKKYLYLLSLVIGAIVLVIVGISIHYQKRAMLNNISKISTTPFSTKPLAEKTPVIVKDQSAGIHVPEVPESSTTSAVQPQIIEQKKLTFFRNNISKQSFHQVSQDEIAVIPLTPASINHIEPPAPNMQTEVEVENLRTSTSSSDGHFDGEKSSTTQKSDQMEAKSIVGVEEPNNLFADILEQAQPAEERIKAPAPAAALQQTSKQKETSSVFSEKRYRKVVLIKPKERKIREKKLPVADNDQTHQGLSIQDSLRQFVQSYTTAYMSRDIRQFALFFTKAAQENGKPFSEMHAKYKQLFNTTQSIDYNVDLLGTDIQDEGTTATLTGRFRVQLIFSPDKVRSNSGTISFFLVKRENNYRIKALSYHLDPKW